jgi:hypothetical protein
VDVYGYDDEKLLKTRCEKGFNDWIKSEQNVYSQAKQETAIAEEKKCIVAAQNLLNYISKNLYREEKLMDARIAVSLAEKKYQ